MSSKSYGVWNACLLYVGGRRKESLTMSKNQHNTPRKPATKYAHLRKKMQQQKVQVRQIPGKFLWTLRLRIRLILSVG